MIYTVGINGNTAGFIATQTKTGEKGEKELRDDLELKLINHMGFENVLEYQNNLPGHSEKDRSGYFMDRQDGSKSIFWDKFEAGIDESHFLLFIFHKYTYYEGVFKDLRRLFFNVDSYPQCKLILQPTIKELEQIISVVDNIRREDYLLYCSDWDETKDDGNVQCNF